MYRSRQWFHQIAMKRGHTHVCLFNCSPKSSAINLQRLMIVFLDTWTYLIADIISDLTWKFSYNDSAASRKASMNISPPWNVFYALRVLGSPWTLEWFLPLILNSLLQKGLGVLKVVPSALEFSFFVAYFCENNWNAFQGFFSSPVLGIHDIRHALRIVHGKKNNLSPTHCKNDVLLSLAFDPAPALLILVELMSSYLLENENVLREC